MSGASGAMTLAATPARVRLVALVTAAVDRGRAQGLTAASVYLSALDARACQIDVRAANAPGDPPRVLGLPVRQTTGKSRVYAAGGRALTIPPVVPPGAWTHYWRIRATLPERFGQPCRIVATGKMNSIEVEFPDGDRHIVSRYAVRRLPA